MSYNFKAQLKSGNRDEDEIIKQFEHDWAITKADRQSQRQGIDFFFVNKHSDIKYSIELKSDRTASRTGNAFV